MPLVPYEQVLAERGQVLTGLAQPTDNIEPSHATAIDVMAAALRQNNTVADPGALADIFVSHDQPGADPNYDPLSEENLAGFEPHAMRFVDSGSPEQSARIKDRIRMELANRRTVEEAGAGGLAASIAAGLMDPVTLASLAVPEASGPRLARIGRMIATSITLDTAQEGILHQEQELRTLKESAINVGAGALLSGALGGLATRMSRADFEALKGDVKANAAGIATPLGEVESTGGAARVGFGTTLEDETVAKGGQFLVKTLGQISPLGRLITSPAKRARILLQELADIPFKLNKHFRGIASPDSAESEILSANATRYELVRAGDAAWAEHRAGGGKLSRGDFDREISAALIRDDVSPFPEVAKVAQDYRKYFNQSRTALEQAGLLPNREALALERARTDAVEREFFEQALVLNRRHNFERLKAGQDELSLNEFLGRARPRPEASPLVRHAGDDLLEQAQDLQKAKDSGELLQRIEARDGPIKPSQLFAQKRPSYRPRLYDHAKIRADRIGLQDALRAYFTNSRVVADSEIDSAIDATIDNISGVMRGHAQIDDGFVVAAGPLNGRTLRVPDEVLEPWLVSDVNRIMESYIRTVTPQLVLKRRFGDVDLAQALADVRDEYSVLRARESTNEGKARVTERMKADLRDLQALRDRLLGTYGVPVDPDSALLKTARVFRTVNYLRLLGGQMLSSLPDAGRVVARHGLIRTGAKLARLITSSSLRKLTAGEAHRMATALEFVMDTRSSTFGEIGDELVGSKLDRILRRESNRFSRLTGMASWNASLKTLAVGLEQDAIVRAARGGGLQGFKRANLAELGIGDDMLERIRGEISTHATDVGGLFRSNSQAWVDTEAARTFERAIRKSADTVVMTKGQADTPLLMSKELGKTLFQFKSFGMVSVNRLLIPMAQGLARGDIATLNGAWVMLTLGAFSNAARDWAAGKEPTTDPTRVAIEAFDRAGFTSYLAEPADALSGLFGGPRFGRFTSQSPFESLTGPTFGTGEDVYKTLQGMFTEDGKFAPSIKASDVYRFRKLLPYQNLFWLRRLINGLEGEFSEGVGAEGAGDKDFAERVAETAPLKR